MVSSNFITFSSKGFSSKTVGGVLFYIMHVLFLSCEIQECSMTYRLSEMYKGLVIKYGGGGYGN